MTLIIRCSLEGHIVRYFFYFFYLFSWRTDHEQSEALPLLLLQQHISQWVFYFIFLLEARKKQFKQRGVSLQLTEDDRDASQKKVTTYYKDLVKSQDLKINELQTRVNMLQMEIALLGEADTKELISKISELSEELASKNETIENLRKKCRIGIPDNINTPYRCLFGI